MNLTHVEPGPVANFLTTLNSNFDAIKASGAIDTASLADGAVTTTKISDGAVTALKISDGAVTTPKISDGAIDVNKINTSDSKWQKFIGNLMYPLGSYYWSNDPTPPSNFFGGDWIQIKNRFLFAAGDSDPYKTAGSLGGEEKHKLLVSEMPSHIHSITDGDAYYYKRDLQATGDHIHVMSGNRNTTASGGGAAHNNMPPYLVAYCWRRKELATY